MGDADGRRDDPDMTLELKKFEVKLEGVFSSIAVNVIWTLPELKKVNEVLDKEHDFDVNRVKQVVQAVVESRHNRELLDLAADMLSTRVARISTAGSPVVPLPESSVSIWSRCFSPSPPAFLRAI